MRKIIWVLLPVLFAALLMASTPMVAAQYQPPHTNPGPAVDRIIVRSFDLDIAPAALEAGDMDYYLFAIRAEAAAELRDKGFEIYSAPAGLVDIIVNPAPAPEGELNPFSIPEVRFALNYIVDRDFVVNEIYKGAAAPMITFLSSFDYDYVTIFDIIARYEFTYDIDYAKSLVEEAMKEAGAELVDGIWHYNGKPIVLKFIIRTEDERREIGDAFASALEQLGFQVERLYMEFGQAIDTVYGTDPAEFQWHLYTEGWGKGAPEKYDSVTINQFCAPWVGFMPGWATEGFWQYENPELDELGLRIYRGEYTDLEQRNQLYRKATEICILESIRIWVATRLDPFPASPDVQGLTEDTGAGLRAPWNMREAYVPGENELTVGHLWVWTETTVYNPVGGFEDVYSVDVWRNLYDIAIARHPFTGAPMPFRATYKVETAGPFGKLPIPEDAVIWDAENDRWVPVGAGAQATSKITYDLSKYTQANWHHGQKISMADFIYGIAQLFDIVYDPEKAEYESPIAATVKPTLDTFKGFRFVDENTLEVYVDYWHFDENYIAEYGFLRNADSGHMPWEILAAMDKVVFEDRAAAYSQETSTKNQVPWLSLVIEDDARMVRDALQEFLDTEFFPESWFRVGDKVWFTKEEALQRYQAAINWFDEKGILVISDGPFYLNDFDPAAQFAELVAFRDPSYPFKPGDWYFGRPQPVEVLTLDVEDVEPGAEATFTFTVSGPGTLAAKYLVIDPATGELYDVGDAVEVAPGEFEIKLSPRLTRSFLPGEYKVVVAAFSDQVSLVGSRSEFFEVLELPMGVQTVTVTTTAVETQVVTTTVGAQTVTTTVTTTRTETVETVPPTIWAIFAIVLIIAVAATAFVVRRRS